MKKVLKSFATTLFVGASFFTGINIIDETKILNNEINEKQVKSNADNRGIYNLAPGQDFDPNDSEFDDYWNKLSFFINDSFESYGAAFWMAAIENVKEEDDNYQIKFDYSFYSYNATLANYTTHLSVYNTSKNYIKQFILGDFYITNSSYRERTYNTATITVPQSALAGNQKLFFDAKFQKTDDSSISFQVKHGNYDSEESYFDLNNYEYLEGFYIDAFSILSDSITDEGFDFLVDIKLVNGEDFLPWNNTLILYSNNQPLSTTLTTGVKDSKTGLTGYSVTGLKANTTYTNLAIGIIGYNELKSVGNIVINTNANGKLNENGKTTTIIVASTISLLILLLLILLIILLLLKRRKKVVEYNYYHNYRTFVDQQGNYIEMNQAEYDTLDRDVAAQYTEIDLHESNNYYGYQQ